MERWWVAARAMVLALLLASCGATQPPAPAPPSVSASPWRARITAAALEEWRAWAQITVDGWPEALPREPDPRLFDRILGYWSGVPEGEAIIRRHRAAHDALVAGLMEAAWPTEAPAALPSISLWAYPAWSAAFVSHVMARSGVPGFVFPPASAHAFYIDALLSQANWNPEQAAFLPHDPVEYAPQPGDLLCADRSRLPLLHWRERLYETGQFRPMHCDVVVAGAPAMVQVIGGNVLDAVALRRFPADGQGRPLPPPPDKAPFLIVFENRLDALP